MQPKFCQLNIFEILNYYSKLLFSLHIIQVSLAIRKKGKPETKLKLKSISGETFLVVKKVTNKVYLAFCINFVMSLLNSQQVIS